MPKKTAEQILGSGNHYLLQVKGNQPQLLEDIDKTSQEESPSDSYEVSEQNSGRTESRKLSVFKVKSKEKKAKWKGLKTYIKLERKRDDAREVAYYMSDLENKEAEYFYKASRGHWSIENNLHRVKEVVHQEDTNRIKNDTGAIFTSIASSIAINRSRKEKEQSISYSKIFFRSNIKQALKIIRT